MKAELAKVIYESKNNKHSYNIKSNKKLYKWLLDETADFENISLLERVYIVLNDTSPVCPHGNIKKFSDNLKTGYYNCGNASVCVCSKEQKKKKLLSTRNNFSESKLNDIQNKRKKTNKEKYGVEHNSQVAGVKTQKEKTFMKKYGHKTSLQDDTVKEKIKSTLIKRFGVDNPMKNPDIVGKVQETNISRYGHVCTAQNKNIRDKIVKRNKEKFGVSFLHRNAFNDSQLELLENKEVFLKEFESLGFMELSRQYSIHPLVIERRLNTWGIKFEKPEPYTESFITNILKECNINYNKNDRSIISPYELDFYIEEKNIAIETCGLYWHREEVCDKNYHLKKLELCESKGIQLITIFSDEIDTKPEIVKSRLFHMLGKNVPICYARQCSIKETDAKLCNNFLNKYHIQGAGKSSVKLGAFYDEDLVAVMTFSRQRVFYGGSTIDNGWELVRFCCKGSIPGIAGKLLKYFENSYKCSEIISYADRRWSMGDLYKKLGFVKDNTSKPNYWYTRDFINREHRFNSSKYRFLTYGENPNLSESEIMKDRGFSKIWDCGTLRYRKCV